jgi:hypothetical protein
MAKSRLTKYATFRDVTVKGKWLGDPNEIATIEVHMDIERIARAMGQRALINKSGVAMALNGAMMVKAKRQQK